MLKTSLFVCSSKSASCAGLPVEYARVYKRAYVACGVRNVHTPRIGHIANFIKVRTAIVGVAYSVRAARCALNFRSWP